MKHAIIFVNMRIRKAIPKDTEGVYQTFLELVRSEDSAAKKIKGYSVLRKRKPDFEKQAKKSLLKSIRQRKSLYLVAEIDSKIVGYAYATIIRYQYSYYFQVHPIGYLNAIVVRKKYRGKGIAKALFAEVEKWFKIHKCIMATLDVFYTNPAIKVYTKKGYKAYDYRMFKLL